MELFVNRNYAGKRLKIGGQEFERGFWAHAPSVLVFELDGKYEWFETSFGLDALADRSGSSEFVIADSVEIGLAAGSRSAATWRCLLRDFPGRQTRHEIERELADGIWDGLESPRADGSALRSLCGGNRPDVSRCRGCERAGRCARAALESVQPCATLLSPGQSDSTNR